MKTARFIKDVSPRPDVDARLFLVNETGEYLVVSATIAGGVPETFIFRATANGTVTNWNHMPGSYRGSMDHEYALKRAGIKIVGEDGKYLPNVDRNQIDPTRDQITRTMDSILDVFGVFDEDV